VNAGQDGDEVGFEGPDGPFCLVAAVHIQWDLLMRAFPFVGDTVDVLGACFVVKYLRVNRDIRAFSHSMIML
jgi:hypothetical protein